MQVNDPFLADHFQQIGEDHDFILNYALLSDA